jgi:hypothetical protein
MMRVSRHTLSGLAIVLRLAPVYAALGLAKHLVRVDRLARWAWRDPSGTPGTRPEQQRVVSLVLRLGSLLGQPDRDCLQRSLLIYRELSRLGEDPRLFVAFRHEGARLVGHAWVECDGRPVTTEAIDGRAFSATWTFGPGGRLLEPASRPAVRAS